MSDKLSLWAAVKDNWGQITIAGTILVALHLFVMSVMVSSAVSTALENVDLGTDQKIITMDTATALNTTGIANNKENITINRDNVTRTFAAMMGRPVPNDNN